MLAAVFDVDYTTVWRWRQGHALGAQAEAILHILNTLYPGPLPVTDLQPA